MQKRLRSSVWAAIWMVVGLLGWRTASAQQLEVAHFYLFQPQWLSQGYIPSAPLTGINLMHQHRQLNALGWNTTTQFLDIKSKPLGSRRSFGWGLSINNDAEHTERRINVIGSFGARIIQTEFMYVGLGISAGMVNWGSNYLNVPVYHPQDHLINRAYNFSDLDAGFGGSFGLNTYTFRATADLSVRQLPGSLLSDVPLDGLKLSPHLFGGSSFLYGLVPDLFAGPMVFYRNTFSSDSTMGGIQKAQFDVGLKAHLDRPKMWGGVAYRLGNAAITAAYGLQLKGTDTTDVLRQLATFLDLNIAFSYPMNNKAVFGPSAEIGLVFSFGAVGELEPPDTIGKMRGAFWVNNGNMNTHKERYLVEYAPTELDAVSEIGEEKVYMTYEWDDNMYMYAGDGLKFENDTLISVLGMDWQGVDNVLENMVNEVIREGLHPSHMDVENPDSLEPLKDLISVGLISRLKFDALAADFGAEGMVYNGELGTNDEKGEALEIAVRYDGRDTVVRVLKGSQITNLELACLKLYAMSRKLEYELNKYYGVKLAFVKEGVTNFDFEGKKVVLVRTPEVIPNNPNQKPFQRSAVLLGFSRDVNWVPTITKRKTKANTSGRDPKSKRERNQFRDPVGGTEEEEE